MSPLLETFGFASARGWRVPSNGGAPSYELIESQILSGTVASVTFSAIPQNYKHIQIRYDARGARAAVTDFLAINLNGDVGANYWYHDLRGNGTGVAEDYIIAASSYIAAGNFPASTGTANSFGAGVIDIANYSVSTINKTTKTLNGYIADASLVGLRSGAWFNTSAVTSVTLKGANAGFLTGSRFSLYGIKGE